MGPGSGGPVQGLLWLALGNMGPQGALLRRLPGPIYGEPSPLLAVERWRRRGARDVHSIPEAPSPHELESPRVHFGYRPDPYGDDAPIRRCRCAARGSWGGPPKPIIAVPTGEVRNRRPQPWSRWDVHTLQTTRRTGVPGRVVRAGRGRILPR